MTHWRNGRLVSTPVTKVCESASSSSHQRLVAGCSVRDELGEQRVVAQSDLVAFRDAGVDANRVREDEALDHPSAREEVPWILCVEAGFDRVAVLLGADGERLARRDQELKLDEVEARECLRHRMLDLDPRVELEEVGVRAIDEELDRSEALVADCAGERRRTGADRGLGSRVERRRRRFLDHLLVAPLKRAVPKADDRHSR